MLLAVTCKLQVLCEKYWLPDDGHGLFCVGTFVFMQDGHLPRVSSVGGSVRVVHVGGSPDSAKRPRVAITEIPSRRLRSQCSEVRYG